MGELGDIYYPWHPWHDHKVRVHATLVKRGRAVARCRLADVPTCRLLEVPLWMLDAATCCQMRTAESSIVEVAALRELKALLSVHPRTSPHSAMQDQPRYLLHAGGADADVVEPTAVPSTGVVFSAESATGVAGVLTRNATEGVAIAGPVAAAARRNRKRRSHHRGGAR
jgi:hypothetical protein